MDYWKEAVEITASELGITMTEKQIDDFAGSMEIWHENYGMATGNDVASSNLHAAQKRETEVLERELERERNKVHCKECNGKGRIITSYGTRSGDSQCWKCNGEGRHDP